MPLYEYKCNHCSNGFTLLQSLKETKQFSACPKCSSLSERVISSGSFRFKHGSPTQSRQGV